MSPTFTLMTPLSYWIAFHVAIVALMGLEYLLHVLVPDARHKAMAAIGMWVAASLGLAVLLLRHFHAVGATQYLAGYALEQAMSLDNLFVFLLLFRLFRIPAVKQPKVLFWGVAGAIVLRGLFIASGVGLLNRFHWIEYAFGGLLLVAAVRLLKPEEAADTVRAPGWIKWLTKWRPISENQDHFFVRENGQRMATVMMLAPAPTAKAAAVNPSQPGQDSPRPLNLVSIPGSQRNSSPTAWAPISQSAITSNKPTMQGTHATNQREAPRANR